MFRVLLACWSFSILGCGLRRRCADVGILSTGNYQRNTITQKFLRIFFTPFSPAKTPLLAVPPFDRDLRNAVP
jgi:hypothetical protein